MKHKLIISIIAVLFTISCSTMKKSTEIQTDQEFPKWKSNLTTLDISANFVINFTQIKQSVITKISMSGLDSAKMSFKGPFSIPVGKFFADPDKFVFYNIFENTVYKGKPSAENLKRVINIPLSFNDFARLIRCETILGPSGFKLEKIIDNKNLLYRNESNPDFIDYALISPDELTLVQYQRKSMAGQIIFNAYYFDYNYFDSIKLAKKVSLKFPAIDGSLTINLNEIEVNKTISDPYSFKVPSNASTVNY